MSSQPSKASRRRMVALVLAASVLVVAVGVFHRPLIAWFTGKSIGGPGAPLTTASTTAHGAYPSPSSAAAGFGEIDHYTCPMHPSVKQQTEGKCPLCGMDL